MNSHPETQPIDDHPIPPASMSETHPLYWSVRRELWENRSIYIAPLVVTGVVLFASLMGILGLCRLRGPSDPVSAAKALGIAPAPIMFASFLVAMFYCLDALYGERRDRSILFWKSLPVSDVTTVLSKASIPFVVLPLIAFVLSVVTQIILLFASAAIRLGGGASSAGEFRFFEGLPIMIYGLAVHVLWFAPIYGWLLLVSAWAKRATFLWALLPLLTLALESVVGGTYFRSLLKYRFSGAMTEAFVLTSKDAGDISRLSQLDPANFLTTPGLWVGLAFAAAFLVAAVRLRRYREPI